MRARAQTVSRLGNLQAGPIGAGEVHAWIADLADLDGTATPPGGHRDEAVPDRALPPSALLDRNVLDPAEIDRAARYAQRRDGARFAASRACLRLILGSYLDKDPADLRFVASPSGRPALGGDNLGELEFSLSRSGDQALIAVSLTPVGADIEIVRPRAGLTDVIASRFSPAEASCIGAGCGGSPVRGFYRHWTAKEAYLKATGRGLAGLRGTELGCGSPDVIRVDGAPADGWTLSLPQAPLGSATAIVGGGPVTQCRRVRQ